MLILLGSTVTASFFDSLNPSAIAQQLLLQAMVKHKRHILFFILGIGLANLLLGLAVYCGISAWVLQLLSAAAAAYPALVYGAGLLAGLIVFFCGIRLIRNTRRRQKTAAGTEAEQAKAPARLTPLSLFLMGAAFCGVELTSALPYFGFLTMLAGYQLAFPLVLGFILLYNFIYLLPLLVLYWGYNRLQGTVLIRRLEQLLGRVSAYVVPGVLVLAGVLLTAFSLLSL